MEKVKTFFRKIGAWIKKHKMAFCGIVLAIVVVIVMASCQGLANVNGSGNTMILGNGNSPESRFSDSFNSQDTEIKNSFNTN